MKPISDVAWMERSGIRGNIAALSPALRFAACGLLSYFEESLREIHVEMEDLNAEAVTLDATVKRKFEELGV